MNVSPTIANTAMTTANTEYSYTLPNFTTQFSIKLRDQGWPLKIAVVSGESGTTYITVPPGGTWSQDLKAAVTSTILYFQCEEGSMTAEIISWQN